MAAPSTSSMNGHSVETRRGTPHPAGQNLSQRLRDAAGNAQPVANSPKSSIVTPPAFSMPIPIDRLVAPAGIAGVVHVACAQEEVSASAGDCVQYAQVPELFR